MKKTKTLLSILISVCMLISSVQLGVFAIEICDGETATYNITVDSGSSKVTSGTKVPVRVSWANLNNGVIQTSEAITMFGKISVSSSTYYRIRFIINNADTVSSVYGTTASGTRINFSKSDDYSSGGKKYTTYKSASSGVLTDIYLNLYHSHNYFGSTVYTEPTCTEPAYAIITCKYCHNQIKDILAADDKQPLGHNWTEQAVIDEPGCESEGKAAFVCLRCGDIKEDSLPATGHHWGGGTVVKEATCEESGIITYTCKNDASHTRTVITDPIGHDWNGGTVIEPASCEEDGLILYTCDNSPEHTKTEAIPATGHMPDKIEAVPATEEHEGNIEYWYCSQCDKCFADDMCTVTLAEDDIILPKLPPKYNVSVKTDGNGTLSGDISGEYTKGTQITVDAVEAENSIFDGWYNSNNELVSSSISYSFAVDEEVELTARFKAYSKGELNADSVTDINDVTAILGYLSGTDFMPEKWSVFADIDGNGEINLMDAYLLFCSLNSTTD